MNELREAVSTCKDFVATSERGWKERGTLKASPTDGIGDESLAFSTVSAEDPGKGQAMTVVRTDGSLAVYLTSTDGEPIPAALMKLQHERLQEAGK
ncbi:hypothetical protein ACFQ8S_02200 [Streptomyces virginiae]|uniref:hypothetical protein n=1 Tax=Streptomyces virginiae TaxID=1961 RepID=UPI0036C3766F